jgi:hypothetical protein
MNIIDSASESIARARLIREETRKSVEQLRGTIESQQMAQKIVQLESKLSTTYKLLIKFLDRTEAYFDNKSEEWLKENIFPEDAQDYLDSAKWMEDNFGRTNNRINEVQEWLDSPDSLPG